MSIDINVILKQLLEKNSSDLHIGANYPPKMRIDEKLVNADEKVLTPEETKKIAYGMLTEEQIAIFEKEKELDFSFEISHLCRFRVNVFLQRGNVGIAIRLIPFEVMGFEEAGLPMGVMQALCRKPKGLVLITGATGTGKSTTLSAMVDFINDERECHIITIEDPIEFVFKNKKAIIDQREVHHDTHTFGAALKYVLRQDPDVILIGEMRDLETIAAALIIAETGHLVLATLHTSDSVQTVNRIIDVFPSHQQQQIRTQLSFVLVGIIAQLLVPKKTPPGRVLVNEILIANPAVRALIRESKVHQIYSQIQTGQREGMRTMNQALATLYKKGIISYDDAFARSSDPSELAKYAKGSL
ncbi:MAG: type IV pilus twitching motility protein PilT [Candidatus Omnitrophica bacterium]|nr:type IV pilus twitching motility protein PilT [Candidatus Omnitrophota bacterium]